MKFSSRVPSNIKKDTTILAYLSNRFTYHSADKWRDIIESGAVCRNGVKAVFSDIVSRDDEVVYDPGDFEEPPANLTYKIVYEDGWYIGVDKPGNLLVHRAGRSFRNNLIYQLRYVHEPPYPESHTVHRLDRDTSGIVLVAKTSEACAKLSEQFAKKAMDKEYVAIVNGVFDPSIKRIDSPIGKAGSDLVPYRFWVTPDGKEASTLVLDVAAIGKTYSLLTLRPLTGRTHQIRVHLASVGNIIVGDKLYGMDEETYVRWRSSPSEFTSELTFPRHALHCKKLSFMHPYYQKMISIETDIAQDMKDLIKKLEKCN